MMYAITRRNFLVATTLAATVPTSLARAATHEVQMLTRNPEGGPPNVFLPRLLTLQPGDTVKFLSVNPGHNSASIDGMLPDGVEAWNGRISQELEVTFEQPGYCGYMCTPHYALGMVGLIIVEGDGKLDNLEAARAVTQRGRAKVAFDEMWAQAEADGLLS